MITRSESSPYISKAEQKALALPRVEVDINLNQLVDNIEVDIPYFADLMARNGMSDDDIAETTLFISADTVIKGTPDEDDPLVGGGHYDPVTRTAHVNVGSVLRTIDYGVKHGDLDSLSGEPAIDKAKSALISGFAVHELSHRIDRALGIDVHQERLDHYRNHIPEKLGGRILRRILRVSRNPEHRKVADIMRDIEILETASKEGHHEVYLDEPAEQRASQIAEKESEKFDESERYPIIVKSKNFNGYKSAK